MVANKQYKATSPEVAKQWLNDTELAALLGLSVKAVRAWRLHGKGPRYRKFGSAVRYGLADISAWAEAQPAGGGSAS